MARELKLQLEPHQKELLEKHHITVEDFDRKAQCLANGIKIVGEEDQCSST